MTTEINEIIKKNLPAQVGDMLQERLKIADDSEKTIPSLNDQINKLLKTVSELESRLCSQKEIDQKIFESDTKKKQLEQDITKFDIGKLTYKLEAEQEKTAFAKEVALGLVRNIEYRRVLSDITSGPDGLDNYGNQRYSTHSQNSTESNTII